MHKRLALPYFIRWALPKSTLLFGPINCKRYLVHPNFLADTKWNSQPLNCNLGR